MLIPVWNWPAGMQFIACLLLGIIVLGCGNVEDGQVEEKAEKSEETEQKDTGLPGILNQVGEAIEDVLGGPDPVAYEELVNLLPDEVAGLDRTEREGEHVSVLGVDLSVGSATYVYNQQSIEIAIVDMGSLSAATEHADWLEWELDRESNRGYERTRTFRQRDKEYPGYEQFEQQDDGGKCEIQVIVEERFVISVDGKYIQSGQCEEALEEISFRRLERMKKRAEAQGAKE